MFAIGGRASGGAIQQYGASQMAAFWPRPDNSFSYQMQSFSASAVVSGLPAGTYEFGLAGASSDWQLMAAGSNVTAMKIGG